MKRLSIVVLGWVAIGCASNSYAYEDSGGASDSRSSGGSAPMAPPSGDYAPVAESVQASAPAGGGGWGGDYNFESAEMDGVVPQGDVLVEPRPQLAQNTPAPQQAAPQQGQGAPDQQATDGVDLSGPLLIYTARFHLGVYEVTQTQDAILEQFAELGAFLARRTDVELVLRVPAARFQQAVDRVEGAGDVLHREVNVQDVGEEFRDIVIRLRNAEVMRDRLEQLLERADAVEDALAIERELQRLTDIIERFKGRQRHLADQISFSTITIVFQPLSTEPTGPDGFSLPFPWLEELGLSNLMRLR